MMVFSVFIRFKKTIYLPNNMAVFLAKLKDGNLDFGSDFNRGRFKQFARDNDGKQIRIELPEAKRSDRQHRYYWLYLEIIERETGNDANDLHELFKRIFLKPKHLTVMGKEFVIPKSTKDLTKIEFGEYLERICERTGVPLPDPIAAGFLPH